MNENLCKGLLTAAAFGTGLYMNKLNFQDKIEKNMKYVTTINNDFFEFIIKNEIDNYLHHLDYITIGILRSTSASNFDHGYYAGVITSLGSRNTFKTYIDKALNGKLIDNYCEMSGLISEFNSKFKIPKETNLDKSEIIIEGNCYSILIKDKRFIIDLLSKCIEKYYDYIDIDVCRGYILGFLQMILGQMNDIKRWSYCDIQFLITTKKIIDENEYSKLINHFTCTQLIQTINLPRL